MIHRAILVVCVLMAGCSVGLMVRYWDSPPESVDTLSECRTRNGWSYAPDSATALTVTTHRGRLGFCAARWPMAAAGRHVAGGFASDFQVCGNTQLKKWPDDVVSGFASIAISDTIEPHKVRQMNALARSPASILMYRFGCGLLYAGGPTSIGPDWFTIVVRLPLWMPTVAFGVYPFWWLCFRGPLRRRRRKRRGLCIHCGYDLRGSESGECPECGAAR